MTDGWFAALRSDGAVARGSQRITVNGEDFGVGIAPAWFDHETLVIKDFDDRLYKLNVTTGERLLLTSHQVQEHAAGGGVWAYSHPPIIHTAVGRDGSIAEVYEHGGNNRDRSILLNGKEIHRGIVNNAMTEGGYVTWSRYEPREVWGRSPDGQIRKLADGLFGLPIMTPDGAWALIQTHTELLALPWAAADCQIIRTGNDNNFYPDALWVGGIILAVWNTHDGQPGLASIDITAAREPFPGASVPPPIPEPPMSDISRFLVPRIDIIEGVKRDYPHLKGARLTDQVIHRLNRAYSTTVFGRKARNSDGSNPNDDVVTVQRDPNDFSKKAMIDVLIDGGGRDEPTWSVIPEHEEEGNGFWRAPVAADLDGAAPVPVPQPTGKHAYEGGDNDTGECDYIDRNGDTCRQPPSASVHQVGTQPPSIEPPPGDVTLAEVMAQLQRLSSHLGLR
jgi:hypothetical protein